MDRANHKVFRGHAFIQRQGQKGWSAAGWARIMVLRDGDAPLFDGAFRIDGNNHHIETATKYRLVKHQYDPTVDMDDDEARNAMVVWRDSDVQADYELDYDASELKRSLGGRAVCSSDMLDFNNDYDIFARDHQPLQSMSTHSLFGRQSIDDGTGGDPAGNLISSIGSVSGCPTTKKVALVGIATDCEYWGVFGSKDEIQKHVLGIVNKASEVYESTFKISLAVRNLTVIDKNCTGATQEATPWNMHCSKDFDLAARLNTFSQWRGKSTDSNAYWTLLTTCATDAAVGLAWRGQLCRQGSAPNGGGDNNDTIAGANVVVNGPTEWQIFAHETGHTFGAVHDCTPDQCPVKPNAQSCCPLSSSTCDAGSDYIMNPSTDRSITKFSPCSIGNICSGLKGNVKSDCLTDNKNVKTITESICGNGIVEPGEECDCGGEDGCSSNKCCDPKTCKFVSGAVCDPANEDCCSKECKFASSDTVCRASTGDCDPEEMCPGDAANCPEDKHKDNGESCGDGLECASGQCTSRDRQCQVVAGGLTHNNNTKACRNDCLMQCESDSFMGGQCAFYNQYFLDGTTCSGGGRCEDGKCKGSSWWKEFTGWYDDNLKIAIPVTVIIGGLIVLAISSCIFTSIKKRLRRRRAPPPPRTGGPPMSGGWHPHRAQPWVPSPLSSSSSPAPVMSAANGPGGYGGNNNYGNNNYSNNNNNYRGMDNGGYNGSSFNGPNNSVHPTEFSSYPPPPVPPATYNRTQSGMRYV